MTTVVSLSSRKRERRIAAIKINLSRREKAGGTQVGAIEILVQHRENDDDHIILVPGMLRKIFFLLNHKLLSGRNY
jgi:hypothetical protein